MDAKQIAKLIASDGARVAKIAEQKKYAGGYNVAILGRRAHEEPDNRIPTPICKTGVNLVVGYMAVDGKISYSTGDDPYWDEKLKPIFEA
ncbi:MAG: hypothetical protein WC738_07405, partial [Candidatus Omnitrophota bacterium]